MQADSLPTELSGVSLWGQYSMGSVYGVSLPWAQSMESVFHGVSLWGQSPMGSVFHGVNLPWGQSMGSQRVGHDLATTKDVQVLLP